MRHVTVLTQQQFARDPVAEIEERLKAAAAKFTPPVRPCCVLLAQVLICNLDIVIRSVSLDKIEALQTSDSIFISRKLSP